MNQRDFVEWLNYHTMCLPSTGSWIENNEDPDRLTSAWSKALDDIDLKSAIAATDAMVSGDLERPFPEETAATVRRYAANLQLARRSAQEPPGIAPNGSCGLCRGTGLVTIWGLLCVRGALTGTKVFVAPSGMHYQVESESGDLKRVTEAVGCKCWLGESHGYRMRKSGDRWERVPVPRYGDSPWHCPVQWRDWDDIKSITHRQRVLADCEVAGCKGYSVTEWEYSNF